MCYHFVCLHKYFTPVLWRVTSIDLETTSALSAVHVFPSLEIEHPFGKEKANQRDLRAI